MSAMNTLVESAERAVQLVLVGDPGLWRTVALSLEVSGAASVAGAAVGLLLGAWLALARFPGAGIVVGCFNTLLAVPTVVLGLLVYLLLSRAGPLGELGLLFTPGAMVVAQSLLVLPLVVVLVRRLVLGAWAAGGEQLTALGAGPLAAALLLVVHERAGVVTILLTAFGRAISEVGAVMIVGGNIEGVTRVMTTAIALETSKGDLPLALALGGVLLAVVGAINAVLGLLQPRGGDGAAP